AYLYGRSHWPEGFAAASRRTDVVLGSINTALLLTSSAFAAVAVAAAEADQRKWVARCLWVTAALGVVFLAIKGMEWHAEWSEGLFPGRGFRLDAVTPVAGAVSGVPGQVSSAGGPPAAASSSTPPGAQLFFVIYFVMTGLHAVHMIIGIGVISVMAWRAPKDAAELKALADQARTSDEAGDDLAGKRAGANLRVEMSALYWHFVDIVWIFLYPLLYLVERHS
ncbi:MAG: hypothetical protein JWQ11_2354, partial [Rhizobacter sp.]|nr:hypothetical protein [Rhizobacter sp.]